MAYTPLLHSINASHARLNVMVIGGAIHLCGQASVFFQTDKRGNRTYSLNLLQKVKSEFQNTFRHLEPDGKLLEVAFYKNVSNDFDWILMVK